MNTFVPMRRRLLLVDDHPVVRQGLALLINQKPDLIVCGEAANVEEGLAAAHALHPDLAVSTSHSVAKMD